MKSKYFISAVLLALIPVAQGALVAHYTLDNTAVSQVNSPAADGTINGAVYSSTIVSPYPGSTHSLRLSPGVSNLNVATGALSINGSYTISTWVNIDIVPTSGTTGIIFGAYQAASPFQHNYLLRATDTGAINFINRDNDGSTATLTSSALTVDTWYFLAATFDSATSTATLYIDGTSVGSTAMTGGSVANFQNFAAPTVAGLGGSTAAGGAAGSVNGFVDDARVYDTVLSATEIQALMVPEPSTALLTGLGLLALLRRRR